MLWDTSLQCTVHEWVNSINYGETGPTFAFSPDSKQLLYYAGAKGEHFLHVRDVASGNIIATLRGPSSGVSLLGHASAAELICTWLSDTIIFICAIRSTVIIQIWDARTFELRSTRTEMTVLRDTCPLLSLDGRWLALRGAPMRNALPASEAACVLWDLPAGSPGAPLLGCPSDNQSKPLAAAFDSDGARIAVSFADNSIRIWSTATREQLSCVFEPPIAFSRGESAVITTKVISFSPMGQQILSRWLRHRNGGGTGTGAALTIWGWYPSSRDTLRMVDTPSGPVCSYAASCSSLVLSTPDGATLVFAYEDGHIQICRLTSSGAVVTRSVSRMAIPLPHQEFGSPTRYSLVPVLLSPDGQRLIWGTVQGEVEIFSLENIED